MLRTIDFNRQLQLITVEVDDVGADCILPAEFEMNEPPAAKPTPQLRLTRRWVLPHSPGTFADVRIGQVHGTEATSGIGVGY